MQQIDVDFEVWKALTLRRKSEGHSYNDVLRELLQLTETPAVLARAKTDGTEKNGRALGGRFLPNGTRLRSNYKGEWHHAEIVKGALIGSNGLPYDSASAAARAITNTNVNGLTFWEAKRPSDSDWRKLVALPRA